MVNDALVESVYKDIPRLPHPRLLMVSNKFQISETKDFNPHGDQEGNSIAWMIISQAVLFRDNYSCRICEKSSFTQVSAEKRFDKVHLNVQVHHITPRKDGGKDTFENLITLCEECHRKTFSTGYSGVPISGQSTIYNFGFKINLCIQPNWAFNTRMGQKKGFLNDYRKVMDVDENRYAVVPAEGYKVKVLYAEVTRELYGKIVRGIESDLQIADYATVKIQSEVGYLNARVLVDEKGEFLI